MFGCIKGYKHCILNVSVCKLIFMTGSVVTLQTLTFHIDANMEGCSSKNLCFPAPCLKLVHHLRRCPTLSQQWVHVSCLVG